MKSEIIKKIRSLDKDLRGKFRGQALFQVTFAGLRDCDLETIEAVKLWYEGIFKSRSFIDLRRLWNENSEDYWSKVQKNHDNLPEYQLFKYKKLIFVTECRNSMPEEIKKKKKI